MLVTLEEAKKLINDGKVLHIAADESLLKQLPKGNWIGGTTPYFITEQGGLTSKEKLYIDEITCAVDFKVKIYTQQNVFDLTKDAYDNGFTLIILPFASEVAVYYAKEAPHADDLLMTPVIGWISGFDLATESKAMVFDGTTGSSYSDRAVALHICLKDEQFASLGIVNIFQANQETDKITFFEDSLSVTKCLVNGQEVVFADYLAGNRIDSQLPLVADYNGVSINVSIKAVNEGKSVDFYAPVFAGQEYYFACPVQDYAESFAERLQGHRAVQPVFSCNCILNYLYGKLEGKSTPPFAGPITFGEVAYQLLNQTLVYAEILNKN